MRAITTLSIVLGMASVTPALTGCERVRDRLEQSEKKEPEKPAPLPPPAEPPFSTPPATLEGALDVPALIERLSPSVVNITADTEIQLPGFLEPFGSGRDRPPAGNGPKVHRRALGSGFIVDPRGHVVTNAHVVEGASEVKVKLADERELVAHVKGRDKRLDLAVLELQGAENLTAAVLGSSEGVRVGEYVVAIGNPFGLGHTVTMGIVSAKSRAIGAGPYDDFIQTDASINPGNSGGPLFNARGEVIGINTAINASGQGIGFAIPSDDLRAVLPQLLDQGYVARGSLGVAVQPIDADMAKALGLADTKGALVGDMEKGGPAEKAGIREGDVILSVAGTRVDRAQDLPRIVARYAPGATVVVEVSRRGSTERLDVELGRLEEPQPREPREAPSGESRSTFGLELKDGEDGGARVERVAPDGAAAGKIVPGDVIVEVARQPVQNAEQAARAIKAAPRDKPLLVKVRRGDRTRYVALEPPAV
jgi:serine protease Do